MTFRSYRVMRRQGEKLRLSGGVQFQNYQFTAKTARDEELVEGCELFKNGHIICVPGSMPKPAAEPVPVPAELMDVEIVAAELMAELSTMKKDELLELVTDAGIEPKGTLKADLVRALVLNSTGVDLSHEAAVSGND